MGSDAVEDLVAFFNRLDSKIMDALIGNRVECSAEIANHPTIQYGTTSNGFEVGFLGILNGFFLEQGLPIIYAHLNGDGVLTRFSSGRME